MTAVSSTIPTHGNYHNHHVYQHHRTGGHDSRLALLPREPLTDAHVLDVGCNKGWVSCEIAQSLGARRVVGVDIDDPLVRIAWRRRCTLWSHQALRESERASSRSMQTALNPRRTRGDGPSGCICGHLCSCDDGKAGQRRRSAFKTDQYEGVYDTHMEYLNTIRSKSLPKYHR